jgi:hypothetical protein
MAIVLTMSYGLDRPLRPKGVEAADHTHAFDTYCNPFSAGEGDLWASAKRVISESATPAEIVALGIFGISLSIGGLFYWLDPQQRSMRWLLVEPTQTKGSRDIVLPNSVIATVSLLGLIAASVVGCFLYYPPVNEIRKEMHANEAEMFGAYQRGEWDKLEYWIPIQEDWAHKLKVSATLRGKPLDRYEEMKLQVYKSKLELLEHAAEDRDLEEARDFGRQMSVAFRRLKEALSQTR